MQGWTWKTGVLLGALLIGPASFAREAPGGQTIHRCIGSHGEIVFSGVACAAGASATARLEPVDTAPTLSTESCPTSREALEERISAAVARRDPNALASLVRWRGVGSRAAGERLRALRDLVQRPLLGLNTNASNAASDIPTLAPSGSGDDAVRVRTGSNESDGIREHQFGVDVENSCYWLTW